MITGAASGFVEHSRCTRRPRGPPQAAALQLRRGNEAPPPGATIHNPATGALRPVELITDRAKRYRANTAAAGADISRQHCCYCGATNPRDLDHVNGREADSDPSNLVPACRSCNAGKGALFARLKIGKKTAQYNPAGAGAATLAQWTAAVLSITPHDPAKKRYGAGPMEVADAVQLIRDTPPARRSKFGAMLSHRRARGGRGKDEVPF